MRILIEGAEPAFPMPDLATPTGTAPVVYVLIGGLMAIAAAAITATYGIEDAFENIRCIGCWWPTIGALADWRCRLFHAAYFGRWLSKHYRCVERPVCDAGPLFLVVMKFISWSVSLSSGTSGGTLARLFTIGAGLGLVIGQVLANVFPAAGIDQVQLIFVRWLCELETLLVGVRQLRELEALHRHTTLNIPAS